ncbi:lysine--tRNA ligase [Mycobacterium sp. BK086]|uniref:lysine--tRNA ligase n=1 Tax=Mycobacterium sp. BK086 TaxID=2512165 RepID=UPI001414FBCE|nr:lysine--tRNA ligase [Mycobacterium sp. BK086]
MQAYKDRGNPERQYSYNKTHGVDSILKLIDDGDNREIATAGRLLAIRDQGGLIFCDLNDMHGSVQLVVDTGTTPDADEFQKLTIGDWIGVKGSCGRTRRGEPSVFLSDWVKLAATEIAFPDKHKGIINADTLARQRYLHLASTPEARNRFIQRSKIVALIRDFLHKREFIEVETPILQPIHGGAHARPFVTHHNTLDIDLYLRIAPELYLKRLVVGGLERVFEIGRVFRNEGMSTRHNPEFSMMEAYAAYWDYTDQMDMVEHLVQYIAIHLHGTSVISYQGQVIDLSPPWQRISLEDVVSDALGVKVSVSSPVDRLKEQCQKHDVDFYNDYGPGRILLALYEKLVEHKLQGPIFITEYPTEASPLARRHRAAEGYSERFEVVVCGRELCNGYTELNQSAEQLERFREQESAIEFDDEAMKMDHDFIRALKYGLPPTAGVGIGIDRLTMLLTDSPSIKDVILFPTQRGERASKNYEGGLAQ